MKILNISSLLFILLLAVQLQAQIEAPSWVDFAEKAKTNELGEASLSDYSYAGYHFSEKEIPDISTWRKVNVTDFGALPNDTIFDDEQVQAAIKAIDASGKPTVLFFPAGQYLFSPDNDNWHYIEIRTSNIVLKGEGTGPDGTELFFANHGKLDANGFGQYQIVAKSKGSVLAKKVTIVTKDIARGDFEISVENASELNVGQAIALYTYSKGILASNFGNLQFMPDWESIVKNGMEVSEKHIISKIDGNIVTFKNPVQLNLPQNDVDIEIRKYNIIEEVGFEDILFSGGWINSEEVYVHHITRVADTGWSGLYLRNAKNSWMKNCEWRHWNDALRVSDCIAVAYENVVHSGKAGHAILSSKYSYGLLYKNCKDIQITTDNVPEGYKREITLGHGPSFMRSTVNTVVLNFQLNEENQELKQSFDFHGKTPYSVLIDNASGGRLEFNGGDFQGYPHAGPYNTFWNFNYKSPNSSSKSINFWDISKRTAAVFAFPNLIGFQSDIDINFSNTGVLEAQGKEVYPKSLFDAQLQLRLYGSYMSASSSEGDSLAVNANDGSDATVWASKNSGAGEWLMLDLGVAKNVSEVTVVENENRVNEWKLEGFRNGVWETLKTDTALGAKRVISIDEFATRKLRLSIISMKVGAEDTPVFIEKFEVSSSTDISAIAQRPEQAKHVSVYPIPSHDVVNIQMHSTGNKRVTLYNINGKVIAQQNSSSRTVQFQKGKNIPEGIYIVTVESDNMPFYSGKIVFQ